MPAPEAFRGLPVSEAQKLIPDGDPVERTILWAAIEDYVGLWELPWELASSNPDIPETQRRRVAQEAVQSLLRQQLVLLCRGTQFAGEQRPVGSDEVESILSDSSNWTLDIPQDTHFRLGATKAGEAAYNET
jgi:hypothetical protein